MLQIVLGHLTFQMLAQSFSNAEKNSTERRWNCETLHLTPTVPRPLLSLCYQPAMQNCEDIVLAGRPWSHYLLCPHMPCLPG